MKGGDAGQGLTPTQIWNLTLPELTLYLTETPKRSWSGGEPMTDGEIAAYMERFMAMDNTQKLAAARAGLL